MEQHPTDRNIPRQTSHMEYHNITNLKRKNSCLDQDSNLGLQLYALVLYQMSHPDELLGQARMFPFIRVPVVISSLTQEFFKSHNSYIRADLTQFTSICIIPCFFMICQSYKNNICRDL